MRDPGLTGASRRDGLCGEPPCEDMDPWVTEERMHLGFEWDQIQDSLMGKRHSRVVATHPILSTKKPKVQCHTIMARPFCSPDPNSHNPSATWEIRPEGSRFGQAEQQPEDQESRQKTKEPASPLATLESRTTTPSPAPQRGPGDSRSAHGSGSGTPEPAGGG